MTKLVFFAVVKEELLQAVWNALVKGGADKRLNMAAVVLGGAWVLRSRGQAQRHVEGPVTISEEIPDAVDSYRQAAAARRELLAGRTLPAEIEDALRTDLAAFDRAIEETLAALEQHPDDLELRAHLTRTLRAQIRYLTRVEASAGETS